MIYVMNKQENKFTLSKPLSFFWEPTEFCNLSCKHCYTSSSPQKKIQLDFSKAKKIVDKMYDEGIYSVGIGGGEPLLIPFLIDLIDYINSKNMNVSITSNGLLLTKEYLSRLKSAGLKIMQISIDGLKENHEYLRGEGTFEGLLEKIHMIKDSGIGVRVGSVVNSVNYLGINEFIEHMKLNGVELINFFRYMPINSKSNFLQLTPEQLKIVTSNLIKHYHNNVHETIGEQKRFYVTFEPLSFFAFLLDKNFLSGTSCTAGQAKFNLSCDGGVSLCNYIPKTVGNINNEPIEIIWKKIRNEAPSLNSIPIDCKDCDYATICKGGCKGFSFINGGNYQTKDTACFKHLI